MYTDYMIGIQFQLILRRVFCAGCNKLYQDEGEERQAFSGSSCNGIYWASNYTDSYRKCIQ